MKIAITGDVMLGRLVNQAAIEIPDFDPAYVWGDCMQPLLAADLRLINLECVIATYGQKWRPHEKAFHFRAHPRAIEVLRAARIDFASLANNHILDYDAEALRECLRLLNVTGIAHAGAGESRQQAQKPAIIKRNGLTMEIISLTDNEPEWEAKDAAPGTFYIDYDSGGLRPQYRAYVQQAMQDARRASDILVISAHVGPNWGAPSQAIRALAHELIDMGADCYWGHSNHTPQGMEIYCGKPILYATGDFIDDYAVAPRERNDLSFLFVLDWNSPDWELTMVPTKISDFQVNRVSGEEAAFVMDRMENLSQAFNTSMRRDGQTLTVSSK